MQIDIDHSTEVVRVFPDRRHGGTDPGIVDQDIDFAEMAHGRVDQRRALHRLPDVGDNGKGPPPDTDDLCADFGQPVGATASGSACRLSWVRITRPGTYSTTENCIPRIDRSWPSATGRATGTLVLASAATT